MLRKLRGMNWFEKFGVAMLVVIFVLMPSAAWAMNRGFWEMVYELAEFVVEMCPIRHPLGHWGGHTTNTLSIIEWGILSAVALVFTIRLKR